MDLDQMPSCLTAAHRIGRRSRHTVREIRTDERNLISSRIFSFARAVGAVYGARGVLVFLTIKEYHHEASTYRSRRCIDRRARSCRLQRIA
jgi:hypothetical protein